MSLVETIETINWGVVLMNVGFFLVGISVGMRLKNRQQKKEEKGNKELSHVIGEEVKGKYE